MNKNIWIIPTDKSTYLYEISGELTLSVVNSIHTSNIGRHIYITADKEIKSGVNQWYLDKFINKPRNSGGAEYGEKQNVILLTTDQDLIADGVQDIDNEFIEWLIKNPECENVKLYELRLCTSCGQQFCDNLRCRGYNDEIVFLISFPENTNKKIITYCNGYELESEKISFTEPIKRESKSYTEEDVKDLIEDWTKMATGLNVNFPTDRFNDWFEQFKK